MTIAEQRDRTECVNGMPSKDALEARHGFIVGGPALARLLGYRSGDAFRKATQRGTLPVRTFTLPNRKGQFARTADVARWLSSLASDPEPRKEDFEPSTSR